MSYDEKIGTIIAESDEGSSVALWGLTQALIGSGILDEAKLFEHFSKMKAKLDEIEDEEKRGRLSHGVNYILSRIKPE